MKYLKSFLTKETLLNTSILLISLISIEIGLLCRKNLYCLISVCFYPFLYTVLIFCFNFFNWQISTFLIKSSFWSKFKIVSFIFTYCFNFFYNFSLALFKSVLWSTFIASKLLHQITSWYLALIYYSLKELS